MEHQYPASSVSRSFFSFLLISRQSLVSVAGCPNACGWQWQGFRVEYAQTRLRKIPPETALLPDLASAVKATRYLCTPMLGCKGNVLSLIHI